VSCGSLDLFCLLLVDGFWAYVAMEMTKSLTPIFSAANPTTFHASFTKSQQFLESFSSILPSESAKSSFEAHPATVQFNKQFQLSVYFQLLQNQVMDEMNNAISETEILNIDPKEGYNYKASLVLSQTITRIWDPLVYIQKQHSKFMKLTTELASKYLEWCRNISSQQIDTNAIFKIYGDVTKLKNSVSCTYAD
jgi:hypothetical protein